MDDYAIPDHIDRRLRNWSSWAKVRRFPSHCRSIEHRYKPEAGDTWDAPPPRISVDLLDAYDVERAWAYGLPMREKMILKAHYFLQPVSPTRDLKGAFNAYIRRISRALGIGQSAYNLSVYRAAMMLDGLMGEGNGRLAGYSTGRR